MKDQFDLKALSFYFGPDDAQYKIILEFYYDQMRQLFDHPTLLERPKNTPSRTYRHSVRVTQDMHDFARFVDLGEDIARILQFATDLHDIGKMDIPLEILDKPGKLTDGEFAEVKRHTDYGAKRIKDSGITHPILDLAHDIALYHHECPDGKGYHGLMGDQIPTRVLLSQVCDVYDAVSAKRPYRGEKSQIRPIDVMKNMILPDGFLYTQVDQKIAREFVRMKAHLMDTALTHSEQEEILEILCEKSDS